jgi:hypothetical protein
MRQARHGLCPWALPRSCHGGTRCRERRRCDQAKSSRLVALGSRSRRSAVGGPWRLLAAPGLCFLPAPERGAGQRLDSGGSGRRLPAIPRWAWVERRGGRAKQRINPSKTLRRRNRDTISGGDAERKRRHGMGNGVLAWRRSTRHCGMDWREADATRTLAEEKGVCGRVPLPVTTGASLRPWSDRETLAGFRLSHSLSLTLSWAASRWFCAAPKTDGRLVCASARANG